MPILTRYILSDLAKAFLLTLVAMTTMMLLVGVLKEALQQGLGLAQLPHAIPYILPEAIRFSAPATILLAVCSVYGRMAANNEVVAVKSFGISPLVLLWPTLIAATLLSLAMVWVNDSGVAWGRMGLQRVLLTSAEDIIYGALRSHLHFSNAQFSISVKRVDGRKLIDPTLTFHSSKVTITADEAELRFDHRSNSLTIAFRNATIEAGADPAHRTRAFLGEYWEETIPLVESGGRLAELLGPSNMPNTLITIEIKRQEERIAELKQRLALGASQAMATGDFMSLVDSEWQDDRGQIDEQLTKLHRLEAEPQRRWANGFSCLCFVLVGAPIAMRMRNSGLMTTFFLCFGPILICYYPLLAYGLSRAKVGAMPPCSVWLGNAAMAIVGLWLLRKVVRY